MKTKILFTGLFICIGISAFSQNFRKAFWNESAASVKDNEKAIFISSKTLHNNIVVLDFVEFADQYIYEYSYHFKNDKLYGIKTRRSYLSGENAKYIAITDYREIYSTYVDKYKGRITDLKLPEEETNIKTFEVALPDRKVYVTIEKIFNDYCLVENIFKN